MVSMNHLGHNVRKNTFGNESKEDPNRPTHLRSLISGRFMKKLCILGCPECASEDSDQPAQSRRLI